MRPGECGHQAHAFEDRLAADHAVGLPQRIDAARLAQIDPAPEPGDAVERKLHQPQPDRDISRHGALFEGLTMNSIDERPAPRNAQG